MSGQEAKVTNLNTLNILNLKIMIVIIMIVITMRVHHLTLRRCESDSTLEDCAQRRCAASILGDTQIPTGHDSEQFTLADSVLTRGLD